jgi:outer membrane protein assembly factor BamB
MRLSVRVLFAALLLMPVDAFGQGTLLWQLQQDVGGGLDLTRAITLSGNAAVIVGNSEGNEDGERTFNLFVESVRRRTGDVQWTDQAFLSSSSVEPLFLAKHETRVFVVGTRRALGHVETEFLVRAYDVPTGALLWENAWMPSPGAVDADHPTGIVAGATAVAVFGYGNNANRSGQAFIVRTFDQTSGTVLWEDSFGADATDVIPWAGAINRNRLFVAAATAPTSVPLARALIMRAYDLSSGAVQWEITRPDMTPTQMLLTGGRVYVGGYSMLSGANTTYLGAFSAKNGAPVWENSAPLFGLFTDIAIDGARLVGTVRNGRTFAVQAFDLNAAGTLLWQDIPATPSGFAESADAVALNDGAVYVAGHSGLDFFGPQDFTVRAYAAATGALLWEDRYRPPTAGVNQPSTMYLSLGKKRLFVAGSAVGQTTSDIVIRAYDIRADVAR